MMAAGDLDAWVFNPHPLTTLILIPPTTTNIPPGFLIESLTISVPVTGRTVGPGSTQNITFGSPWFVCYHPDCFTRRNTEIFLSGLMFEHGSPIAENVCPLVNSQTV